MDSWRARLNIEIFTTSEGDSGALGLLDIVVHQLAQVGTYELAVFLKDEYSGAHAQIEVTKESKVDQVDIDLATVYRDRECHGGCSNHHYQLAPDGFVLLRVSKESLKYAVQIAKVGEEGDPKVVFDSRQLRDGDIYILTLFTPGEYNLRNVYGDARAALTVKAVDPRSGRPALDPVEVLVNQDAFSMKAIECVPTQPVVFGVKEDKSKDGVRIIWEGDGRVRGIKEQLLSRRMRQKPFLSGLVLEQDVDRWMEDLQGQAEEAPDRNR